MSLLLRLLDSEALLKAIENEKVRSMRKRRAKVARVFALFLLESFQTPTDTFDLGDLDDPVKDVSDSSFMEYLRRNNPGLLNEDEIRIADREFAKYFKAKGYIKIKGEGVFLTKRGLEYAEDAQRPIRSAIKNNWHTIVSAFTCVAAASSLTLAALKVIESLQ